MAPESRTKKRITVVFMFVFKAICGHLHETREFLGGQADSLSAACYPRDQGNKLPVIFRQPRVKALVEAIVIKGVIVRGQAQRPAVPPCWQGGTGRTPVPNRRAN